MSSPPKVDWAPTPMVISLSCRWWLATVCQLVFSNMSVIHVVRWNAEPEVTVGTKSCTSVVERCVCTLQSVRCWWWRWRWRWRPVPRATLRHLAVSARLCCRQLPFSWFRVDDVGCSHLLYGMEIEVLLHTKPNYYLLSYYCTPRVRKHPRRHLSLSLTNISRFSQFLYIKTLPGKFAIKRSQISSHTAKASPQLMGY